MSEQNSSKKRAFLAGTATLVAALMGGVADASAITSTPTAPVAATYELPQVVDFVIAPSERVEAADAAALRHYSHSSHSSHSSHKSHSSHVSGY